ncbi:MAG: hypothetical protein QGF53_10415, partial [Alphaproteobacteria bacterium]|nr:hypothetical protein [Alphaproteobacteria bacterium]
IGACIGREFGHDLLAAVSPMERRRLGDALQQLIDSALIYVSGAAPVETYTFKHALVQDTAYESLLKSDRAAFHRRIAEALESTFPHIVEANPEIPARHYSSAGQAVRAVPHWLAAGQLAIESFAYAEAVSFLKQALSLLDQIPSSDMRDRTELTLQTLLGVCGVNLAGWGSADVVAAFGRAGALLDKAEKAMDSIPVLVTIGMNEWVGGSFAKCDRMLREALDVAEQADEQELSHVVRLLYGCGCFHMARSDVSDELLSGGIDTYDPNRHRALGIRIVGQDLYPVSLAYLGLSKAWLGYLDQSWSYQQRAAEAARADTHPNTRANGLSMAASGAVLCGRWQEGVAWSDECIAFCEAQQLPVWLGYSKLARGYGRSMLGEVEAGINDITSANAFLQSIAATEANGWAQTFLADIYIRTGKFDEAESGVQGLLAHYRRTGEEMARHFHSCLAPALDIARHGADATDGETMLIEGLALARNRNFRLDELRLATLYAHLRVEQGRPDDARDILEPVYGWFREGFRSPFLTQAKSLLDELG